MSKKTIIALLVIIVLIIVSFLLWGHGASQPQPESQSNPTGTTTQTATGQAVPAVTSASYTSPSDGFSVNFSGTPQVTRSTFNSPTAGQIPVTKYIVQSQNESSPQYYVIYVYHYPQNYQFSGSYLSGALLLFDDAVNAKYPGTKLTGQSTIQFLGSPAISGTLSVPIGGKETTGYTLITVKNQNTYGIGTYGVNQSDYNAFINSFTFTQ